MRPAATRSTIAPDRVNRAALTGVGLVLAAAGGYGLARGWGAFGEPAASEPLLLEPARQFVVDNGQWFWPVAAVASLLLGLLGLRWLRAQLAAATPAQVHLTRESERGETSVRPAGAARALAADVEGYDDVEAASARLTGTPEAPEVDLRVDVPDDCDVGALRDRIDGEALARFRQALELDRVEARIEFRLKPAPARSSR